MKSPDTLIPKGVSPADLAKYFDPDVTYDSGGGVIVMGKHIRAGCILVQHKHKYDHLSILAAGTIILDVNGKQSTLVAPQCLTIKAGVHHGVMAVTDAVWYCIHAESEPVTDHTDIDEARQTAERLKGA